MITSVFSSVRKRDIRSPVDLKTGTPYPKGLALLWPVRPSLAGAKKSAVGPAPEWSYIGDQYDSEGSSVGVNPPWHTGKGVWCGPAYTQMLTNSKFIGAVSGTPGTAPTGWTNGGTSGEIVVDSDALVFTADDSRRDIRQNFTGEADATYYLRVIILSDGTQPCWATLYATGATESLVYYLDGAEENLTTVIPSGVHELTMEINTDAIGGMVQVRVGIGANGANTSGASSISRPMLTTLRNAPYVASDTTGPVTVPSAAGTSGGNGLAWEMSAKMAAALSGKCTVAALCTMGSDSSAFASAYQAYNILSARNTAPDILHYGAQAGPSPRNVWSYDGNGFAAYLGDDWDVGEKHLKVMQVRNEGSLFRVGLKRIGTDSSIQWASAVPFDGSFNPLTYLRAAYNNTLPLHIAGIQVWDEPEVDEATIEQYFKSVGVL